MTHIDTMADKISAPMFEITQNVAQQLENSMPAIVSDLTEKLFDKIIRQLVELSSVLDKTAQAMSDFPNNIDVASSVLQTSTQQIKSTISDITQNLSDCNHSISEQTRNTVSEITSYMQESMKNITDDIADKQTTLLALQESCMEESNKLLTLFSNSIDNLKQTNISISETMEIFQNIQTQINECTSNLLSVSTDMQNATDLFGKSRDNYADKLVEFQNATQETIDTVALLLKDTGEMYEEYIQNFREIRDGLPSVFSALQKGLDEYSATVEKNTQKYLTDYSANLTHTTATLSASIQSNNDRMEEQSDLILKQGELIEKQVKLIEQQGKLIKSQINTFKHSDNQS